MSILLSPGEAKEIAPVTSGPENFSTSNERLGHLAGFLIKDPRQKMETPLDECGLVDIRELVNGVRSYVVEDYVWQGKDSKHHICWERNAFTEPNPSVRDIEIAREFRGIELHQIDLPRDYHDLLHEVTIPVTPPDEEVMRLRIDEWKIVCDLFRSVATIGREKIHSEQDIAYRINRATVGEKLDVIRRCLRLHKKIPTEFHLVSTVEPFQDIVGLERMTHITHHHLKIAQKEVKGFGRVLSQGCVRLHQKEFIDN